ncbi:MAG: SurA N-terminal domain-containing protein [Peptococcaceae bacterium]|nr:SurA N-terminal domain-containing protein [Peptococcaceae bacterium]
MIKSWKSLLFVAVILLTVLAAGCGQSNVAATVNGEKITKQQLDDMVSVLKQSYQSMGLPIDEKNADVMKMLNSAALEQLVTQAVMLQEAKKMGIQVSKADVDKEIDSYKKNMGEDKFKQTLAANGWSEPKFRDMLEKDLILSGLQKKIMEEVKPATEAQAQEYYEKNKQEFVTPASYQVRHILVSTIGKEGDKAKVDLEARAQALAILEQLKQGKDFAETAKEKSEDPGTASGGGLYTFSPGEAVPEFETAAKALKPGEMTMEPVKTEYGYHIIKMEKVTPEKQNSFAEVKEGLLARLTDEAKQEKFNKFVEEARQKAEVVNNLDKPEDKKAGQENKGEK